jgi:hypothetical protein
MRHLRPLSWHSTGSIPALALGLAWLLTAVVRLADGAECQTNHPFPGVVLYTETRLDPENRMFIAEIDLANPQVRVRVAPGGPDPDGPGEWQTTLATPTRIAAREGFDLVVNGDFFRARGVKDAEGIDSMFRAEQWAAANGPAVTDGKAWSAGTNAWPCLVVSKNRKVTIAMRNHPGPDDWEVVAGNTMLVEDGTPVPHQSKARHPRTLAGLDATGNRLVLLVADGRKPGVAVGLSYEESAIEMLRLGCHQALNLDGGGSSVMAVMDAATGKLRILNQPSDGRERAVANVLGIAVNGLNDGGEEKSR